MILLNIQLTSIILCLRVFSAEIPNDIKFLLKNGLYENCESQSFSEEKNFLYDNEFISEYANMLFVKIVGKNKAKDYTAPLVIDKNENWFVIFIKDNKEKTFCKDNEIIHILNIDKTSYAMIIRKENGHLISMTIF